MVDRRAKDLGLTHRQWRMILGICAKFEHPYAEPSDLIQDALEEVWKATRTQEGIRDPEAFIRTVVERKLGTVHVRPQRKLERQELAGLRLDALAEAPGDPQTEVGIWIPPQVPIEWVALYGLHQEGMMHRELAAAHDFSGLNINQVGYRVRKMRALVERALADYAYEEEQVLELPEHDILVPLQTDTGDALGYFPSGEAVNRALRATLNRYAGYDCIGLVWTDDRVHLALLKRPAVIHITFTVKRTERGWISERGPVLRIIPALKPPDT